jgi:hypothetical protein
MTEDQTTEHIEQFHHEFFQEVFGSAEAGETYAEDCFFDLFCQQLVEAAEIETADRCYYSPPRGIRIDGYGGDPRENDGRLTLIISDFHHSAELETLTATDLKKTFKRARNFLSKALDPSFRSQLEMTAPAYGLCDMISARWADTDKVRILLISNRQLSKRIEGHEADEQDGRPVTYAAWDIARLQAFVQKGQAREPIEIDFSDQPDGGLPVLPAHLIDADYESFLAVLRGDKLAEIYDKWGTRLLEQNVRVFLQARGKVNKGIRVTLENSPEMFFAYNNGLTATAEAVQTVETSGGLRVRKLHNLQIVNGGQTTASIYAASKNKNIDLSRVFVQMKLSIVTPDTAREIIPRISEFANTQNTVNKADFFSNHPYHVRIEEFSRRLFAPTTDGTFRESKWFYERARGQYQDARGGKTPAERRRFDLSFPKRQMFTKTDLAKFMMVWEQEPHIVSKGAQFCFAKFAHRIAESWDQNDTDYNELHFREIVAKAIVFRRLEKLINPKELDWYEGGYRANIVAYALSKLAHFLEQREETLNSDAIWQAQQISEHLERNLLAAARCCHEILVNPPPQTRNVTEWAKKPECWRKVKEATVPWPHSRVLEAIPVSMAKTKLTQARKDQRELNSIDAQKTVVEAGAQFWQCVIDWEKGKTLITPRERSILQTCAAVPHKIPSDRQSSAAMEVYSRLVDEGCPCELPTGPMPA